MIPIEDFVLNSTLEEPRKATYGDYTLVSAGEGGNRHMYIMEGDKEVGYFLVDTHPYYGFDIYSIRGEMRHYIYLIVSRWASYASEYGFKFTNMDYLDDVIKDIILLMNNKSRKRLC